MSEQDAGEQAFEIPEEIALLPLLNFLVYPLMVAPLAVSQAASVRLIDAAMAGEQVVALVTLRGEQQRPQRPDAGDMFSIGTVALVHRLLRLPDGTLRVAIQGLERVRIEAIVQTEPYLRARISQYAEATGEADAVELLAQSVRQLAAHLLRFLPAPGEDVAAEIASEADPRRLAYLIASGLLFRSSIAERQSILEAPTVRETLALLETLLTRDLAALQLADPHEAAASEPPAATVAPHAPANHAAAPQIRRVVANLPSTAESEQFYTGLLGLTKAMDLGWIQTFTTPNNPMVQVTLLRSDPSGIQPNISVEVDDVDAVYAAALAQGQPIIYPLTDEPWGVRRFFVGDPSGAVVNVLSHG